MHPIGLLIVVLLIALVLFLVVYLWRQQGIEARQHDEQLRRVMKQLDELIAEREKRERQKTIDNLKNIIDDGKKDLNS